MSRRLIVACAAAATLGCADKATAPGAQQRATVLIATAIGAQTIPAMAVDVYVGYTRSGGERVELLKHREEITGPTQLVSVSVDLAPCLADNARPQPRDVCQLRLDIVLRDANDVALDSVTTATVSATPGSTVTPPAVDVAAGVNVNMSFCTGTLGVVFAAFQDGTEPWKALPLTNGAASFRVKSGRGGLTWVQPMIGGGWNVSTQFASVTELSPAGATCVTPRGSAALVGTVTGLGPNEPVIVSAGGAAVTATPGVPAFSLTSLATGLHDVVASRHTFDGSTLSPTSIVIRRGVNATGLDTLAPINFSTGSAPVLSPVVVNGSGSDVTNWASLLITSRNRTGAVLASGPTSGGTWAGIPASLRQPGDLYLVLLTAKADQVSFRFASKIVDEPAAMTFGLGPPLSTPVASVLGTQPYVRIRGQLQVQTEYADVQGLSLTQGTGTATRSATIQISTGYRQGAATAVIDVPNMSGVAGWQNDWGLKPGISTTWGMSALTYASGVLFYPYANGTAYYGATKNGTITP